MSEQKLLGAIRQRAKDEKTRTDFADVLLPKVEPCLGDGEIGNLENTLGFKLHPLHRQLYMSVGNGGYGPGYGILGGPGGYLYEAKSSILEVRKELWVGNREGLPGKILPLCEWGDAIWSCVGSRTGKILTLDHIGLTLTDYDLQSWLEDWVGGVKIFENLFEFEEVEMLNPFTKKAMVTTVPSRPEGLRISRFASL